MSTVIADSGDDLGYDVHVDGETYRAVSGGRTRIDAVNDGLRAYRDDVVTDSLAARRVETAIMTFGEEVRTVCDFTIAEAFHPPELQTSGATPMGAAVNEAIDMLEGRKRTYKEHGIAYFRPWIFLITDGGPTDGWKTAADRARRGDEEKKFAFFAVGTDEGAKLDVLARFSPRKPLLLKGYRFNEMFQWLSQSLRSVSRSTPGEDVPLLNPTGPDGWASV
ncbi:MAG: hypothetical protein WD066_13480 [Planctomycetaceae bacterium]